MWVLTYNQSALFPCSIVKLHGNLLMTSTSVILSSTNGNRYIDWADLLLIGCARILAVVREIFNVALLDDRVSEDDGRATASHKRPNSAALVQDGQLERIEKRNAQKGFGKTKWISGRESSWSRGYRRRLMKERRWVRILHLVGLSLIERQKIDGKGGREWPIIRSYHFNRESN